MFIWFYLRYEHFDTNNQLPDLEDAITVRPYAKIFSERKANMAIFILFQYSITGRVSFQENLGRVHTESNWQRQRNGN